MYHFALFIMPKTKVMLDSTLVAGNGVPCPSETKEVVGNVFVTSIPETCSGSLAVVSLLWIQSQDTKVPSTLHRQGHQEVAS